MKPFSFQNAQLNILGCQAKSVRQLHIERVVAAHGGIEIDPQDPTLRIRTIVPIEGHLFAFCKPESAALAYLELSRPASVRRNAQLPIYQEVQMFMENDPDAAHVADALSFEGVVLPNLSQLLTRKK